MTTENSIRHMTDAQYRAHPSISRSALVDFIRSPQYYYSKHILKKKEPETEAMRFGSAMHAYILEPEIFEKGYHKYDKLPGNTNAGKAQKIELENIVAEGMRVISNEEVEDIEDMADSFTAAVPEGFLGSCKVEHVALWTDPITGLALKAKIDFFNHMICGDLKSTKGIGESEFQDSIYDYKYYLQAAMYLDILSGATGTKYEEFLFVAIEKKTPFPAASYILKEGSDEINIGRAEYQFYLKRLAHYLQNPIMFLMPREIKMKEWVKNKMFGELSYE